MIEFTKQSTCIIAIIVAITVIPKYVKLPSSLELLFQDRIGQMLLLLLAIAVGTYNFICGVLLSLLFLSIIIQTSQTKTEGFKNYKDADESETEMELEDSESFKDETENDVETSPKNNKTKSTSKTVKTLPPMEDGEESTSTSKPKPTKKVEETETMPTTDLNVKNLKDELKTSQDEIKNLELKLNRLQSQSAPTQSPEASYDDLAKKFKDHPELAKEYLNSIKESVASIPETKPTATIEGFGCGCDSSSSSDSRRDTLIKYARKNMDESSIEPFTSPLPLSNDVHPTYDVVGCKYDNGYKSYSDTYHGPPVASCQAYTKVKVDKTGTVFYPLN